VARITDAYCPHLGAHLASHDGCLTEGQIVCPFHKWRFDAATGKCASIPYSKIVPAQAKLTLYPTREIGNQVLVWYHPDEAEPDFEPFDPSVFDADAAWVVAANKRLEGTSPFRDLLENLFDTAHIQQLHGSAELPVPESVTRTAYGMRCAFGENKDAFTIKGMEFNFTGISMVTHFVDGEGFAFMQVASGTPIDHERFLLNVNMYVRDTGNAEMNQFMGQAFANRVVSEIDQDFAVTNFKKHLKQPLLCAGDGPIITWRKYAEEFFV
jgi:3-ketosteroid 9alpha-monooxygenase subunit A